MKSVNLLQRAAIRYQQVFEYKRLIKDNDVVLDPYISLDIVSNSNWAKGYLKTAEYRKANPVFKRKAVVFVIDTAGEITHPDLVDRVDNVRAKSFTGEAPLDGNGHGIGSASCYIGKVNGAAPREQVTIVPLKGMTNSGSGSYTNITKAVDYAFETWKTYYPNHLGIISMSLGGGSSSTAMSLAMKRAADAGMWIAASSGNSGFSETINKVGFPAKDPSAWAIGATDSTGKIASFSSGGDELVFAGPGRNVQIAWKNDSYITANGTSFGMPYTMAALLWMGCQYPELKTMAQAENFFKKYVTDLHTPGRDVGTGHGVPILDKFIGEAPDDKPGENPPPPPPEEEEEEETPTPTPPKEFPDREEDREITFTFSNQTWRMNWQQQHFPGRNVVSITDLTLKFKTKGLAPKAYDQIKEALDWYFSHSGLIMSVPTDDVSDESIQRLYSFTKKEKRRRPYMKIFGYNPKEKKDYHDAGYFAGRFAQIILKNNRKLIVDIISVVAKDEDGRSADILI